VSSVIGTVFVLLAVLFLEVVELRDGRGRGGCSAGASGGHARERDVGGGDACGRDAPEGVGLLGRHVPVVVRGQVVLVLWLFFAFVALVALVVFVASCGTVLGSGLVGEALDLSLARLCGRSTGAVEGRGAVGPAGRVAGGAGNMATNGMETQRGYRHVVIGL
jgi:hypothetical protein